MVRDPNAEDRPRVARKGRGSGRVNPALVGPRKGPDVDVVVGASLAGRRRLSAVLWDFADPFLGPKEDWDGDVLHAGLDVALAVWNAVVMEQRHRDPVAILQLRQYAAGRPRDLREDLSQVIEGLRRRKIEHFGLDHRLVVEHEILRCDDGWNLQVASFDPDRQAPSS